MPNPAARQPRYQDATLRSFRFNASGRYDTSMTAPLKSSNDSESPEAGTEVSPSRASQGPLPSQPNFRLVVTWLCVVTGPLLLIMAYFPLIRATLQEQPWLITLFREHYTVIFGLPSAALLSFLLVIVFEARFDQIEMEIAHILKFRGASGPIVLWVLCFLSIASA